MHVPGGNDGKRSMDGRKAPHPVEQPRTVPKAGSMQQDRITTKCGWETIGLLNPERVAKDQATTLYKT